MLYTVLGLSNVTEKNKLFTFKALLFASTKFDDPVRRKIKGSWQVHVHAYVYAKGFTPVRKQIMQKET